MSQKLDSQLQLIISSHCDELVRSNLEAAIPENTAPTGLTDLRCLYQIFGQNKISQFVQIAASALQILAQKGDKPFFKEHQRFVQLVARAKELLKDSDGAFLEKVVTAVFASSYPQISNSLSIQLSLADNQSPNVFHESLLQAAQNAQVGTQSTSTFLESLSQADQSSAKRKHEFSGQDLDDRDIKRVAIEFYCSHCGKANHSADESVDKDQPAIRLSYKLHCLRKDNSDGKITVASMQQALGISHTPLYLKSPSDEA